MPVVYTGMLICERITDAVKDESMKVVLAENKSLMYLGAVGFNLLEYFSAYAKQENTWVQGLVKELEASLYSFFDMAKSFLAGKDKTQRDTSAAYLSGCVAALSVKRNVAPYLAYATKNDISDSEFAEKYARKCVAADIQYMQAVKANPNVEACLSRLTKRELSYVNALYTEFFKNKKREIIPESFIADCASRLIKTLSQKRSLIKKPSDRFVYELCGDEKADVLNLQNAFWTNPYDEAERSNMSYVQLAEHAYGAAAKACSKYYEMLNRNDRKESSERILSRI